MGPMASDKKSRGGGLVKVLKLVQVPVRLRRQLRGPMRPSWDLPFETWVAILRALRTAQSIRLPIAVQRRVATGAVRSSRPRGLRYEVVRAGGVPAVNGSDPTGATSRA